MALTSLADSITGNKHIKCHRYWIKLNEFHTILLNEFMWGICTRSWMECLKTSAITTFAHRARDYKWQNKIYMNNMLCFLKVCHPTNGNTSFCTCRCQVEVWSNLIRFCKSWLLLMNSSGLKDSKSTPLQPIFER